MSPRLLLFSCGVQDKSVNHCAQEIIDLLNNEDLDPVECGKIGRSTEDCVRITCGIVINCTKLFQKLL